MPQSQTGGEECQPLLQKEHATQNSCHETTQGDAPIAESRAGHEEQSEIEEDNTRLTESRRALPSTHQYAEEEEDVTCCGLLFWVVVLILIVFIMVDAYFLNSSPGYHVVYNPQNCTPFCLYNPQNCTPRRCDWSYDQDQCFMREVKDSQLGECLVLAMLLAFFIVMMMCKGGLSPNHQAREVHIWKCCECMCNCCHPICVSCLNNGLARACENWTNASEYYWPLHFTIAMMIVTFMWRHFIDLWRQFQYAEAHNVPEGSFSTLWLFLFWPAVLILAC